MSLPKHTRTSKGTFRQESGNSGPKTLQRIILNLKRLIGNKARNSERKVR